MHLLYQGPPKLSNTQGDDFIKKKITDWYVFYEIISGRKAP